MFSVPLRNTADSMTLNLASWWWYAHINIRFSYRKNTTSPVHAVLLSTRYSTTIEDTFDPHLNILFRPCLAAVRNIFLIRDFSFCKLFFLSVPYPYVPFRMLHYSGPCCPLSNTPSVSYRNTAMSGHKSVPCSRPCYAGKSCKIKGSSPCDSPILT